MANTASAALSSAAGPARADTLEKTDFDSQPLLATLSIPGIVGDPVVKLVLAPTSTFTHAVLRRMLGLPVGRRRACLATAWLGACFEVRGWFQTTARIAISLELFANEGREAKSFSGLVSIFTGVGLGDMVA